MAKSSGLNFNLPSVDDLFSTEEERAEARLEKVVNLSPAEISDFPNHPFKVRMDEAMQEMTESVRSSMVFWSPPWCAPSQRAAMRWWPDTAGKRRRIWQGLRKSPVLCGSSPMMKPRLSWWTPTCSVSRFCHRRRHLPTK